MRSTPATLIALSCATAGIAVQSAALADCIGDRNVCLGTDALISITTGDGNVAIGDEALKSNQTGFYNIAVGTAAMRDQLSGNSNVGIGLESLMINSGKFNVAIGTAALHLNTHGEGNTATGEEALFSNGTGSYNTATGHAALNENTTGQENTGTGNLSLQNNSVGSFNTASGSFALNANTTASYNTGVGYRALVLNTTGQSNTGNGSNALANNHTGSYNAAYGNGALRNNTTGFRNVAVGHRAGLAVTTGSDNIIIGGGNQGFSADSGVIRIGTNTFQKKAFMAGVWGVKTGSSNAAAVYVDANGQFGTIKSSGKYKEDIAPLGVESERLLMLRPVSFRYKEPDEDGAKPLHYGLIAEEVAAAFPALVVYGKDGGPETVKYEMLSTLLLNELQRVQRESDLLKDQVRVQGEQLQELRREISALADAVGH